MSNSKDRQWSTGFVVPDWNAHLSLDALLDACPKEATTKGMFIQDHIDTALFAGADAKNYPKLIGFKDYSVREVFIPVVAQAAAEVYPGSSIRSALRLLGRQVYPAFARSGLGRAIFGVALNQLPKVFELAPRGYTVASSHGSVKIAEQAPGYCRVELRDLWNFVDTLQIGVWEGAMIQCNVEGEVRVRRLNECDADLEILYQ